jgi:hypothetical protein
MHLLIQAHPPSAQLITYYPHRHTVKFADYQQRTWWVTDKNQCVGPAASR